MIHNKVVVRVTFFFFFFFFRVCLVLYRFVPHGTIPYLVPCWSQQTGRQSIERALATQHRQTHTERDIYDYITILFSCFLFPLSLYYSILVYDNVILKNTAKSTDCW
jgi:hypothetical protein